MTEDTSNDRMIIKFIRAEKAKIAAYMRIASLLAELGAEKEYSKRLERRVERYKKARKRNVTKR